MGLDKIKGELQQKVDRDVALLEGKLSVQKRQLVFFRTLMNSMLAYFVYKKDVGLRIKVCERRIKQKHRSKFEKYKCRNGKRFVLRKPYAHKALRIYVRDVYIFTQAKGRDS